MSPKVLILSLPHRSSTTPISSIVKVQSTTQTPRTLPELINSTLPPTLTMEPASCGCSSCSCQNWYAPSPSPPRTPWG